MSEYLLCMIGTVLLSAILIAILPNGKTTGLIRAITRLVCVLAIISPILHFFQTGEMINDKKNTENFSQTSIETDNEFIKYYSEKRIQQTQIAVAEELLEKYDAQTDVVFDWEYQTIAGGMYTENAICVTKINVRCSNQIEEEVKQKMWEYLTTNYCSEVLIE